MALNKYLDSFQSLLTFGRKKQLNKILVDTSKVTNLDFNNPITQVIESSVTDISTYNTTLNMISGDLGGIFKEVDNIESTLNKSKYLNNNEMLKIDLAISNLESKIEQASNNGFISSISYTDNIIESFNSQSNLETKETFYQNNTIPKAYVDENDGLLKLNIDGEFVNSVSNNKPSNVFLDRIIGIPVSNKTLPKDCFDGSIDTYWNELIHTDSPVFVTQDQYPWLSYDPVNNLGYAGGVACRLKVELDKTTLISELDINPYNQNPTKLIGIGWTEGLRNYILDPSFKQTLNNATYWTVNASGYNNRVGGGAEILQNYGLDSENCLHIYTTISSGMVSVTHGQMSVSMNQGLELDFCLKTEGRVPVQITLTYLTTGGTSLKSKSETIYTDTLGWNRVLVSFDPVENCSNVSLKFTIPVFDRISSVYITNPKLENIKEYIYSNSIDKRTTIFLPAPIEAKTLYLSFSQENYTFKTYSKNELSLESSFKRLGRSINLSENLISWDKTLNRSKKVPKLNTSDTSGILDSYLTLVGTQWEMFKALEEHAGYLNSNSQKSVFEYQIGCAEIYIRHREYESRSRYVSLPFNVIGEIREIRLYSKDSILMGDNLDQITYKITSNKEDSPEKANPISNSNYFTADLTSYTTPTSSISISDYTSWVSTDNFYPVSWPTSPFLPTPQTSEILMCKIDRNANSNSYITKSISSTGLDLRGASTVSFEWFARVNNVYRQASVGLTCSFGVSSDGQTWNDFDFKVNYNTTWTTDNITSNLIFNKQSFNISSLLPDQRSSVKYIRFKLKNSPNYPETVWFALRRLNVQVGNLSTKAITFVPSDDLAPYGFRTVGINDFIVPVKYLKESYEGTDRNGRLKLNKYPYTNRNKIMKLVYDPQNTGQCLSANLGGRRVPYEPNVLFPKYLNSDGAIGTLVGYRPINVSLTLQDGQVVLPDSLGRTLKGEIQQVVYEQLSLADISLTSQTVQLSKDNITKSNLTSSNNIVYQVQYNMVPKSNGINVQVYWGTSDGVNKTQIDPLKVFISPELRTITINSAAPSGYTNVYATYWKIIGEESSRENFRYPGLTSTLTFQSTGTNLSLTPQSYPVTRNMTDYMYGTIPVLKPVELNSLSNNYYPIYEYYIHPDGYLVFAQSFHKYGDTPAKIEVNYQTLDISPRLIIDLTRGSFTNKTPYVDEYKLLLNVRRN